MDDATRIVDVVHGIATDAVAAYLYGSAVVGGLRPDSDIDVLVALDRPLTDHQRRQLVRALMHVSGAAAPVGPARNAEVTCVVIDEVVPWRYPPRYEFMYGEWLRTDFEHGLIPQPAVDPDLTILLATVRTDSRVLFGRPAAEVFDPVPDADIRRAIVDNVPTLLADIDGDERNVILTLARMSMTLATGAIAPKDVAGQWLLERLPEEHRPVLELARAAYLGEVVDDWSHRRAQVAAFVDHARTVLT